MSNAEYILELFEEIFQNFLIDYKKCTDPEYLIKNKLDFQRFVENECPNWAEELKLHDDRLSLYLDGGMIEHSLNVACHKYFKQRLCQQGIA